MNNINPTPPERLRLLRVRSCLREAEAALADATLEIRIGDIFALQTLNARGATLLALANVLSSLKAFDEPANEAVK